jgi:hypothetical protein
VQATGLEDVSALATASAVGAEQAGGDGKDSTGKNVDQKAQDQRTGAETARNENDAKASGSDDVAANPQAKTNEGGSSSGAVTVAAAIGITVAESAARASLGGSTLAPITVTSGGTLTVRSRANTNSGSRADGSGTTTSGGTTVGAAVALTLTDSDNTAYVHDASVTAGAVTVEAVMAERKIGLKTEEPTAVDLAADTIYIGDEAAAASWAEVTYSNGGGTSLGGLTDDGGRPSTTSSTATEDCCQLPSDATPHGHRSHRTCTGTATSSIRRPPATTSTSTPTRPM